MIDLNKQFPSTFGTTYDEQAATDYFEDLCGGVARAQRILHIWNNTYPGFATNKVEIFKKKAKQEGFTDGQIDFFLAF